ncbi:hypothetical protein OsJ_03373 [Oryza sativa Japonica Group]|uniref:serine C-palmitoyltransferase n=1 Tax=Oryza sativa subsp. japonica TaxID=39947 RepID=B9EZK4_ORYSJ|nr:hypothetical protein OsJ_03373 [Oryza sativa Japonica Group]
MAQWDALVDAALARLASRNLLRATRPIALAPPPAPPETFAGPGPWDRAAVEIQLDRATLHQWLAEGGEATGQEEEVDEKLILFSGNDYMGLSSHPAIRKAAVKAAQEYGMGPRGSALICGYTTYHKLVEESLAELKKKEVLLQDAFLPNRISANMAVMTALGSVSSILSVGRKPAEGERIAVFSDALNHASIIDGIRLVERQQEVVAFVYKHCDMHHLDFLLLFSMDGDFAPLPELVKLRRKHMEHLFVARMVVVPPELFGCENDIDISVGTLSKAAGCQGGFIVCRLRITLSASHSLDDIKRLVDALSPWLPDKHDEQTYVMASKL